MSNERLLLHVYGEHRKNFWTLVCLELSIASSATELLKAKEYIRAIAHEYQNGKLVAAILEYPAERLSGREIAKYRMKFWLARLWQHVDGRTRDHIYDEMVGIAAGKPLFS
ncbi:hypothetical protein PTE30175_00514 [Pandoraea terrae]|uniref:Uncharacterized protein n=1 Tax=Pandoraea terrae TaxID=1537710 RepID=A0A5E4S2E8_9BURK|nr:hypothetical protein [Pandoraea terrae]VVD69916.1 hypothetical protein PTE30175_00514 [Pandoraea terrae]